MIISIDKVLVRGDRVDAVVFVDSRCTIVTASVARCVLGALPGLADQVCVSPGHEWFGEEILGTETAHLLEHVAIELLTLEQRMQDAGRTSGHPMVFTGHTSAISDMPDRYQVTVTFSDDLVALASLQQAAVLIDSAFCRDTIPETVPIVERLHALRRG